MNDLPSFVIKKREKGGYSVKINGKEIADMVSAVSASIDGCSMMYVELTIPASCFEAYCDLEIETETRR